MRMILSVVAVVLSASGAFAAERCQQITLVVGFKAGGTSTVAAQQLGHAIGQTSGGPQVIVMNHEGVNGRLAADYVLRQNDRCTLFLMSSTSVLRIPPDLGLKPVGLIARFAYVIVTSKDSPESLPIYMEAARQNKDLLHFATSGPGSFEQLVAERLFRSYGLKGEHIPYNGAGPVMNDLMGGHVPMAIVPSIDAQGKDQLHKVAESGYGIETFGWIGIYASAAVPQEDIDWYAQIFRVAAEIDESKKKLEKSGFIVKWAPGSEFATLHKETYEDWKPELDRLGIKF